MVGIIIIIIGPARPSGIGRPRAQPVRGRGTPRVPAAERLFRSTRTSSTCRAGRSMRWQIAAACRRVGTFAREITAAAANKVGLRSGIDRQRVRRWRACCPRAPCRTRPSPTLASPGCRASVSTHFESKFEITSAAFFSPVTPGERSRHAFLFHHGHSDSCCFTPQGRATWADAGLRGQRRAELQAYEASGA